MAKQKVNPTQMNTTMTAAEQDTGRVWVDGRPIYRKIFRGTINVTATNMLIAHGITMTASMEVISLQGGVKLGQGFTGGNMQLLTYRETAGNWINATSVTTSDIQLTSSFAWGSSWYTIIMEYVK